MIQGNKITLGSMTLSWPAVAVYISGVRYEFTDAVGAPDGLSQEFIAGPLKAVISIIPENGFYRKKVAISTAENLPTPDYVDIDFQTVPDHELSRRGYIPTSQTNSHARAEEEGTGKMPGCGYPLIGKNFFAGLEHQAGFNTVEKQDGNCSEYRLRQHPVWVDGKLQTFDAVLGWSENPEKSFAEYLARIRLPVLSRPLFAFCSFWSDPYLGNYEYDVCLDNYRGYMQAFKRLGLIPEMYTLDAGWNDRQTVFHAKKVLEGDPGLIQLSREMREQGSALSLWVSHNGPMGIAPEYLKSQGIAVGSGYSSTYCGDGYGVLMDEKLESALKENFIRLADSEVDAIHFKIDWDNDCASNPDFAEKYPTSNHVREASINAMNRIAAAMRQTRPDVVTRNGWWPSPWWLCHANHIFLSDSGDSEYAMLPSKNQRNSAATHRDIMYYDILRRDRSAVPLDCFDNHEFPHAPRNPFTEDPATWADITWLAVMRGSTYLSWKQQPEGLEDWQVEAMGAIMEFSRKYADKIFVQHGRMILGNPSIGEIYGFAQHNQDESWVALRNPLPLPQTLKLTDIVEHEFKSIIQFYPDFREYHAGEEITMLAHELKLLVFTNKKVKLPYNEPFQLTGEDCRFPSSLRPQIGKIYQIPELEFSEVKISEKHCSFGITVPYRMRNFEIQFKFTGSSNVRIYSSRYKEACHSDYAIPVTEINYGNPGHGEKKNPGTSPDTAIRYFSAPIAQGGTCWLRIDFDGSFKDFELWAAGYEAPSREKIQHHGPLPLFEKGLPYQHPYGFPLSRKLQLETGK